MQVLLLNAGSSSLKGTLAESADGSVIARASVEVRAGSYGDAVRRVVDELRTTRPGAVGHRIVHGGDLTASVRITREVRARIAALAELAPLHNPPGLETLTAAESLLPDVPHVAVFDTAFHATLPPAAYTYAVPREWIDSWGIRRYGFHGLSHAYCSKRVAELMKRGDLRVVVCHLGHGCSATAVESGRSIDTTMGFTPLEGLVMATRSGSVDPGVLTHVQLRHGLGAKEIDDALNHRSGILGVSGISADMREVSVAAREGDAKARLALDVYAHRVRQAIGALAVTLGGVDALVFTGGVGENQADIRAAACRGLGCLGLELDEDANARARPDADVSSKRSKGRIFVLAAREDLEMLAEVAKVVA